MRKIVNPEKETKTNHYDWDDLILKLAIIALALFVSVWQDNPKYLWLLILIMG